MQSLTFESISGSRLVMSSISASNLSLSSFSTFSNSDCSFSEDREREREGEANIYIINKLYQHLRLHLFSIPTLALLDNIPTFLKDLITDILIIINLLQLTPRVF